MPILVLVLCSQTTILVQGVAPVPKRVLNTSFTFFVLAAHPHRGVLIDSRSFLNLNSVFNLVHNLDVSNAGAH